MPLYEYECGRCGVFTAMKKISAFNQPAECDTCGEMGARIISIPHYALMGKASRLAHERNEQSVHAPRSHRRSSCGCQGTHTCSTDKRQSEANRGVGLSGQSAHEQPAPFQTQTKATARPWMLGH